jgi:hypothetical protein
MDEPGSYVSRRGKPAITPNRRGRTVEPIPEAAATLDEIAQQNSPSHSDSSTILAMTTLSLRS